MGIKILKKKNGFKNRHLDGLPDKKVNMKVVINDVDGERIMLCEWNPFNKNEYFKKRSSCRRILRNCKSY